MKSIFLLVFMLSSALIQAQQDDVWITDYNEAQKIAKEKKLPLFMYFTGSDWCKPCIKLKEDYFETAEFLNKTNDFVLLMVDRPYRLDIISEAQMEKNKALIKKYNKENTFPLMLLLDHKGKVLKDISGYSGDPRYYRAFINENS
ncbi:thioredoxin family protein [Croceibacter atlanticus]|uniref:thioredoxin family protein n=1 Tax=Croceibacter atlanticus TaxID=313588 RepID=UPI0023575783|nr:thioredoxin family protein [Croceibacter atlanticus]|tara:strand:+ start:2095 stop:2529 length:435 start_codon:yes stop_codon:yes gene_type:complete